MGINAVSFGEAAITEIAVNRGIETGNEVWVWVCVLLFLVVGSKSLKRNWQRHRSNPHVQAKQTRG